MFNWIGLGLGAAFIVAVFFAGDHYGFNANKLAQVEAASKVRNAELARLKRRETAEGSKEDVRFAEEDKAFRASAKGLGARCILTSGQAAALNLVGE